MIKMINYDSNEIIFSEEEKRFMEEYRKSTPPKICCELDKDMKLTQEIEINERVKINSVQTPILTKKYKKDWFNYSSKIIQRDKHDLKFWTFVLCSTLIFFLGILLGIYLTF